MSISSYILLPYWCSIEIDQCVHHRTCTSRHQLIILDSTSLSSATRIYYYFKWRRSSASAPLGLMFFCCFSVGGRKVSMKADYIQVPIPADTHTHIPARVCDSIRQKSRSLNNGAKKWMAKLTGLFEIELHLSSSHVKNILYTQLV